MNDLIMIENNNVGSPIKSGMTLMESFMTEENCMKKITTINISENGLSHFFEQSHFVVTPCGGDLITLEIIKKTNPF